MENLPTLNLPLQTLAALAFYLFAIIYIIFTTIFYYHWQSYSMSKSASVSTYIAYFGITLTLLGLMGLAVLAL